MCIECNLYVPPHDTSNGFKKGMCDGRAQTMCYNVCALSVIYTYLHMTRAMVSKRACVMDGHRCVIMCVCVCVLSAAHTHTGQLLSEHTAVTKPQFGLSGNTRMFLG